MNFRYVLFWMLLLTGIARYSSAQDFTSTLDSLIRTEFNDDDGPGGVFMIARKGEPVYLKAVGMANLELGVKLTPDHVFQIGSMTKQITAIAILMLHEQKKLDVMAPVSRYVPDYPGGDRITLHHLLTHTAGIKDFTKMKSLREIATRDMTPAMMVDFFKNEPPDFAPGEKFEYNNSGYVLLGYIIELVSGESYESFIQNHIFKPAGMTHSFYASDRRVIVNRAYGYHLKEEGYVNKTSISFSVPFSSGALMSTVCDMVRWQQALTNHVLLKPETAQRAFQAYTLSNGETVPYGYGWHIRSINGIPTREHGGSIFGFKSMAVYIPSTDMYIIGLSNCDCHSPTRVTQDMAALALKLLK